MKLGDAAHHMGLSEITLRRKVKAGSVLHEFRNGKYIVYVLNDGTFKALAKPASLQDQPRQQTSNLTISSRVSTLLDNTPGAAPEINHLMSINADLEKKIKELQRTCDDQMTLIALLEAQSF